MPFTIDKYQPRVGDYVRGVYAKRKSGKFYAEGMVLEHPKKPNKPHIQSFRSGFTVCIIECEDGTEKKVHEIELLSCGNGKRYR